MLRETLFVFITLAVILCNATTVNKCENSPNNDDLQKIEISNCDKPPCKLKKRTKVSIQQSFTPTKDIHSLITSVNAEILGLPLPFVGVDGSNACEQIYNVDGTKASCPLKKGTEYVYKNEFPVLQIYPTISLIVRYALMEKNNIVTCFEIPARIIR